MTDTTAELETSIRASLTTTGCYGKTPTNEPCNLQAGHGGDCE